MSMNLMAKAMSITVGNPLRKLVLIKLADNANDKGECWPSYQHIADQCEISKRSVMRHIDDLCECGLLRKEYRAGPKGNSSNIYHLVLHGDRVPPPGVRKSPGVVTQSHHPLVTQSHPEPVTLLNQSLNLKKHQSLTLLLLSLLDYPDMHLKAKS